MSGDGDLALIRSSFERVQRRASHVVTFFYVHLFDAHPEVRGLFPADMSEQFDRLFAALGYVVAHLDDPGLGEYLAQLGRDHRKFDIAPEHFDAVGQSLIAALRFGSGQVWDEATEAAWLGAYGVAAGAMQEGARQAAAAGEPRWWQALVLQHRLHEGHTAVFTVLPDHHYPYRPGQFATLQLPHLPGVWRPYSIARAPRRDGILEFHVSRVDGGLLSPVICDRLEEGDRIRLGPASGAALTPSQDAPWITLIAAGSGWSAVKPVVEELTSRRPAPRVRVDLVARTRRHLYDLPTLSALAERYSWLDVALWHADPSESETRATERLFADLAARRDWHSRHVYVSGPPGFVAEVGALLTECGLPANRLTHDPLRPPGARIQYQGHADRFLDPKPVPWIDPATRTGEPVPPPRPAPRPQPAPYEPTRTRSTPASPAEESDRAAR
ncbi:globin domain-containing protein [Streptomyces sp. CA-111067]|uniref:globin domain-containing protein n=1 Tax=Streptomyces sp. CA-111067 TaxID=3240046 RepID=UPI003D99EA1D